MEKRNWLIAGICFALVIACIGGFFFLQNKDDKKSKKQEILDSIVLEFNDMKTVEYGSDFSPKSLLKNEDNNVTFTALDTSKVGEQTIVYTVIKDDVSKDFEYKIEVKDTKAPVIHFSKKEITLEYGKPFDMNTYIKSVNDVVDGDLLYKDRKEIQDGDMGYYTYSGKVDTKKAGTYLMKVTAVDIHNNKSEKELKVVVLEEKKTTIGNTTNQGSENNTPSNDEPYIPNKNNKVIVVNAGHQGKGDSRKERVGPGSSVMKAKVSSGATGVVTRIPESETTLSIAFKLRDELQSRGYSVVMTRTSQNVRISNKERALIGNKHNAAAVISLHCDGGQSSARGAHTIAPKEGNPYNPEIYSASASLAKKVISSYCAATGIEKRRTTYRDDLTGLNWSKVPAIYIEMGFISNPAEDKLLNDSSFQKKCAKGIANGIDSFCK